MSSQRYERVSAHDHEHEHDDSDNEHDIYTTSNHNRHGQQPVPSSPPPSFRSRASSVAPHRPSDPERQRLVTDADRTLADTFDSPSDDEDEHDQRSQHGLDERQRVLSGRPQDSGLVAEGSSGVQSPTSNSTGRPVAVERRVTQLPVFGVPATARVYGGGNSVHDGVFANLSAKPERGGDDLDEKPPTYEQAAADATPPYWETTILTPGVSSDEVFIDGLPVGSLFSFVWNGMISMSFQLPGFLLTYLLHTTHAAKNGSKAGLGITLMQYGFSMKNSFSNGPNQHTNPSDPDFIKPPSDPNNHDFDSSDPSSSSSAFVADDSGTSGLSGMRPVDWFAYALMIIGWFILIQSVREYVKARRHEQLVLQSPARGLNVPVVSDNERPEGAV